MLKWLIGGGLFGHNLIFTSVIARSSVAAGNQHNCCYNNLCNDFGDDHTVYWRLYVLFSFLFTAPQETHCT